MKRCHMHHYGVAAALVGVLSGIAPAVFAQNTSTPALSVQEVQGLVRMVEEEKLAGDVYQALYARTGLRPFGNIVGSERQHQSAVQGLLRQYGIADPSAGKKAGEFTNPEFSRLYQQLVTQGSVSNVAALQVGALVEELDIADLNQLSRQTQRAEIVRVYDQLNRGSRNHLRAFDRTLARQAGARAYPPQHLTPAEYSAIVQSTQERGMGANGAGAGSGRWRR